MEVVNQTITKKILPKSIVHRVASNFGWSIVSEGIGKGVSFITNIYLARTLGVENFGLFTLALTITGYLWFAVDLGTNMYGIREVAKKENVEQIINSLFTLRITSGFVVFSIYVFSLFLFDIPTTKRLVFIGSAVYLLSYAYYSDWVFKGLEKFKFISVGTFLSSISFLIGSIYFVRTSEDIIQASFIWSLSYFFGSAGLFYILYVKLRIKYRPLYNVKLWYSYLKESIYFTATGILILLYQHSPIMLLSYYCTTYEVGLFSAPYRLVMTIYTASLLISKSFYPTLTSIYCNGQKKTFYNTHTQFNRLVILISIIIGLIGLIYSEEVINFLYGKAYIKGATTFKVLIWFIPLGLMRSSYGIWLSSMGLQKFNLLAMLVGNVIFFVTGFYSIRVYKTLGVSFSLILAEMCIIGVMMFIFYRVRRNDGY